MRNVRVIACVLYPAYFVGFHRLNEGQGMTWQVYISAVEDE